MAKMLWRKQQGATTTTKQGSAALPVRAGAGDGPMPRGYVPMRLVGDDGGEDEEHETVLVRVALLKEPGMVEVREMAERQYGQPGVLRIPCDARRFEQLMGLECMAR